ncbi:MAG: hypothetical protein AAF399_24405 [Bacteroidota bacterium]
MRLFTCQFLVLLLFLIGSGASVSAQSVAQQKKSMNRYLNRSFAEHVSPIRTNQLVPSTMGALGNWLKDASIAPRTKQEIRRLLQPLKGVQGLKVLRIKGVSYQATGQTGDAFLVIVSDEIRQSTGFWADVVKILETQKANEEEEDDDDDCRFQQSEDCFCANSDNCDCVSCTGCGCGGCSGCGSSSDGGTETELYESVWW